MEREGRSQVLKLQTTDQNTIQKLKNVIMVPRVSQFIDWTFSHKMWLENFKLVQLNRDKLVLKRLQIGLFISLQFSWKVKLTYTEKRMYCLR